MELYNIRLRGRHSESRELRGLPKNAFTGSAVAGASSNPKHASAICMAGFIVLCPDTESLVELPPTPEKKPERYRK